ncbi:MAG: DoxX family protein, partial [Armatimonadota bacterium]|nr:DoxX family protein [Armatimonadota bacterium]
WLLSIGAEGFFGKLIAYGELVVGILLIVGAFVGISAFFGAFMNWNFMMAGTASTNPMMFLVSFLLILAWKVAGYYGLDRWLLPALGTPWRPGRVFRQVPQAA